MIAFCSPPPVMSEYSDALPTETRLVLANKG